MHNGEVVYINPSLCLVSDITEWFLWNFIKFGTSSLRHILSGEFNIKQN